MKSESERLDVSAPHLLVSAPHLLGRIGKACDTYAAARYRWLKTL